MRSANKGSLVAPGVCKTFPYVARSSILHGRTKFRISSAMKSLISKKDDPVEYCGYNSEVESQSSKLLVEGSIPFARSKSNGPVAVGEGLSLSNWEGGFESHQDRQFIKECSCPKVQLHTVLVM